MDRNPGQLCFAIVLNGTRFSAHLFSIFLFDCNVPHKVDLIIYLTCTESLFQRREYFDFEELTSKTEDCGFQDGRYAFINFGILNRNYKKIYCIFDNRIPGEHIRKHTSTYLKK